MSLRDWYLSNTISKKDRQILSIPQVEREENVNTQEYYKLQQELNIKGLENYNLNLGRDARSLIKELFDESVHDTTLIITSGLEHESVNKILSTIKNKYTLDEYRLTHLSVVKNELVEILPRYNQVFVYVIGVHMTTGFIMPDRVFDALNEILKQKEVIWVLDDVHGLFSVERNRSRFDYVIGTSHALIDGFDTGILFSKKQRKEFGYKSVRQLQALIDKINILKANDQFFKLRDKMIEYKPKNIVLFSDFNYVDNIIAYKLPNELTTDFIKKYLGITEDNPIKNALMLNDSKHVYFGLRSQNLLFLSREQFDIVENWIEKLFLLNDELC